MPQHVTRGLLGYSFLLLTFFLVSPGAAAQYFGRNKVLYRNFEFRVVQTPHFEIYHYLQNENAQKRIGQWSEQWYQMHQSVLGDTFRKKNPLIIYNHHADFQQTRAVNGQIGVGTGGVTEALKNRVVLPFMESNAQTDHVLGHEIVHAFQYHLIKDSLNINAFKNLPLWMVEGMAEYMSTGYVDGHTAMWLRSALAHQQLPTLKEMTTRPDLYFPYRWGEAFWAYLTGLYGDTIIKKMFLETARKGYANALKYLFGTDEKTFSDQWHQQIRNCFEPYLETTNTAPGISLINRKLAGKLNIVPSISPDGKYIAFWTEKNLFSLDLYIADAATGKMVKRLTSNSFNSHVDQYNSYESSVAWSPDSREVAFVAFAKGHNQLLIASVDGKTRKEIDLPGLSGFSSPAWSPDGKTIVVTGLVQGRSDLYAYTLRSGTVKQLTNDEYSDLLPSFSPDGKWIVFSTDRNSYQQQLPTHRYAHNIALLNTVNGSTIQLDFFPGTNNMNPVFAKDNQTIYFLSDRDGFRNLYSYDIATKNLLKRTNVFTGISGITEFAPAISVTRETEQLVYSFYDNTEYNIYSVQANGLQKTVVAAYDVHTQASMLPPFVRAGKDKVQSNINLQPVLPVAQTKTKDVPYKSKFGLDYIGSSGAGIQAGGAYNNGLSGGIGGIFSDMTGDHQLYGAISLNGEIVDVAGQFSYFNQKHRFNWGLSVSHIPYVSGAQYLFRDTFVNKNGDSIAAINYTLDLLRTFEDQVSAFASYPFSTTKRIEAGASFARYYYRLDRYTEFYDETGRYFLSNKKGKQPVPPGFNLGHGYVALVGDQSSFGVASPLAGYRFRLEAAQYVGIVHMSSLLADYRRYFRIKPFSVATRNLFMGRYGEDASNGLLPPLFLGYSSLVRGYDALGYAGNSTSSLLTINDLIGSRIFVSNVELRFPFSGPERLSAIKSRLFFTEFNLFTDGGIAWGKSVYLQGAGNPVLRRNSRFVISTGISFRVNLFGLLVAEPYYAIPWQNGGWSRKSFGVNVMPGW